MTIHTLQDLCYAYRVADPVREMLFALQDRITELEAQKLQDRNAMDAMKLANEQWTVQCRQLEKKLAERSAEYLAAHITHDKGYQEGRQDAEDAHKEVVEPMDEVADRFAHRMALELECVLRDGAYSNKWYKSAMQVLSEYRSAMNAIHEQHSPTFMGEPKI